jgi:hypothetical protein
VLDSSINGIEGDLIVAEIKTLQEDPSTKELQQEKDAKNDQPICFFWPSEEYIECW